MSRAVSSLYPSGEGKEPYNSVLDRARQSLNTWAFCNLIVESQLEIGHDENIYTMRISKYYKSGPFSSLEVLVY